MDDENHRLYFNVRASDHELGMQHPSHIYPAMAQYNEMQTLKRRLPPVAVSGGLFNLEQFKSPAYSIYTASAFVAFLGLYTGQSVHTY